VRFRHRLRLLQLVFAFGMLAVWLRTAQLQTLEGATWAESARRLRQHPEVLDARRGRIVCADGVVVARDRPVFRLSVVPWEWQRRGRARCRRCGMIYFQRGAHPHFPRTCACGAWLRRGASEPDLQGDAYPREGDASPRTLLEKLPDGDVSGLERVLGMPPGEIARRAAARIAHVAKIIENTRRSWEENGDHTAFRETRLELMKQDLLMRHHVLVGRIDEDVARRILTDEDGTYRGLRVEVSLRRDYPQGDFAPRLIGYVSKVRDEHEYEALKEKYGRQQVSLESRVGRRGLERAYDGQLHGRPGELLLERDENGAFTRVVRNSPPRPGCTLHLSLYEGVSREAEKILQRWADHDDGYLPGGRPSGGFVAMDANTGEILMWAETPRFDLNRDLDKIYDEHLVEAVKDVPNRVWRPRLPLEPGMDLETWRRQLVVPVPITASRIGQIAVEPGSTMKPLMALAMLSSGHPPLDHFLCNGGTNPGCHHCGLVDLEEAITHSCNRYFAFSLRNSSGWPVYRTFVAAYLDALGLGHRPTSEIPEWSAGQWLWPWVDFEPAEAVRRAQALLEEADPPGPKLELQPRPGAPSTLGGDPARLARRLASVARWVARRASSSRVAVSLATQETDGRQVVVRFGLRGLGTNPWYRLPGPRIPRDLPESLLRMKAGEAGSVGCVERGGTVWFTAAFQRHVGRTDPSSPPVILPDDGRNVAIGQGPVLVTPLQMVRAVAVLANGGTLLEPHVVRACGDTPTSFARRRIPVDPAHLKRVRDGMYGVANDPAGTAYRCHFEDVPATVYAKTGTAQLGVTWRPFDPGEHSLAWHHWFVGYAEGQGRTIAFACVLHARTEHAAGQTAAHAVQEILQRWYAGPGRDGGR
jgi:cell division protein FtsI/penicillin-binding protein 2